jgi:hypothetical protein
MKSDGERILTAWSEGAPPPASTPILCMTTYVFPHRTNTHGLSPEATISPHEVALPHCDYEPTREIIQGMVVPGCINSTRQLFTQPSDWKPNSPDRAPRHQTEGRHDFPVVVSP